MNDRIVTLAKFTFPTEAYPLITRLEEEGIECFLADENIVSVQPFLSNAVGGVKINIREEDWERASIILKELKTESEKKESLVDDKWKKGFVKVDVYCPNCESSNVYIKRFSFFKTVLAVLFAFIYLPLTFIKKEHFCADCGHIWKE
jgi:hypothetical protein